MSCDLPWFQYCLGAICGTATVLIIMAFYFALVVVMKRTAATLDE